MATRELCNAKRAGDVGKMAAQERFEPCQVEFFPGPYRGWMVSKISHIRFASSSELAVTCLRYRYVSKEVSSKYGKLLKLLRVKRSLENRNSL
jgi:hypothetical protein